MNDFDSCAQRIIKQIYSVLAYEYEMGLTESRGEPSGIYSFQLLRTLHESSMENINKILRHTESGDSSKNEFDYSEKRILLEFLTYLNEKKSELTQKWLNLQHYMHFVYRKLTCPNSQMDSEDLSLKKYDVSGVFVAEMRTLVKILSDADEVQLYLKIFSVLREYVTFAFWQYSKSSNKSSPVERIHYYYQAFMLAAKLVYPVFYDLEKLLKDTCNMTWLNYNKFVFFNYFYDAIHHEILTKVKSQEKLNVPEEYCPMVIDFAELNGLWQTLRNLRSVNDSMDKNITEDLHQILKKNFWICRKLTDDKQNVQRLAAKLIILASERKNSLSEPLLDENGQCLCEDCLIFKLTNLVESSDSFCYRISPCRFCPEVVELDKLQNHVVDHLMNIYDDSKPPNKHKNDGKLINSDENRGKKLGQTLINLFLKDKHSFKGIDNGQVENIENGVQIDVKKYSNKIELKKIDESKDCRTSSYKNKTSVKSPSPCTHSCKHEEELKNELKKLQSYCDHHKDTKICDCTYCEVFGSTASNHLHQTNEMRNRLRIRLNQRKQKLVSKNHLVDKTNKLPSTNGGVKNNPTKIESNSSPTIVQTPTPKPPVVPKQQTAKVEESAVKEPKNVELMDDQKSKEDDIRGILNFIEGTSGTDKAAIAEKKAAKKARQRQKKEDERKEIEEQERRKKEEKKREEEARIRLQKQLEREKQALNEVNKKGSKKHKNKSNTTNSINNKTDDNNTKLLEETIPATVTIKRSTDNGNNRPTITITLNGSTPDQDQLIYTLVNGQTDSSKNVKEQSKSKKNKKQQQQIAAQEQKSEHYVKLELHQKGKNSKSNSNNTHNNNNNNNSNSVGNEVKVSITVNKNKPSDHVDKKKLTQAQTAEKKNEEVDLPFLRLPPGITITKVEGPLSNKNYRVSVNDENNVQVNKSGVIVVDTEKLFQTKAVDGAETCGGKKNKKKKKKLQQQQQQQRNVDTAQNTQQQPSMVTLKNPIFKAMKENVSREAMPIDIAGASCGQASIFKNENGMVTIRSSRLQQSLTNGIPMHTLLSDLKPVLGDEVSAPISSNISNSSSENTTLSSFNAQEILSGLPGIEITKVDKKTPKLDIESKMCQVAQVSIIPTNGDKCNLEKDDWTFDNIFTPKDVLEDELDAEERELEAFKRFCQQSIPPKQKEKVAHLNVKDIVLKKKNDLNSV